MNCDVELDKFFFFLILNVVCQYSVRCIFDVYFTVSGATNYSQTGSEIWGIGIVGSKDCFIECGMTTKGSESKMY